MIESFVGFGIITLVLGLGLGSALLRIRELNEDEWRTYQEKGKPINSKMIEDMWVCSECGAFNSPYNKRCGKCFVPKIKKDEK